MNEWMNQLWKFFNKKQTVSRGFTLNNMQNFVSKNEDKMGDDEKPQVHSIFAGRRETAQ